MLPIRYGVKPKLKHFQERFGDTARYLYEEPAAIPMITLSVSEATIEPSVLMSPTINNPAKAEAKQHKNRTNTHADEPAKTSQLTFNSGE